MKYIVTLNGNKYEVEVEKGVATEVFLGKVDVATTPVSQNVPATTAVAAAPTAPPTAPTGNGDPVPSPMAGNIIQVKCDAGKAVKQGEVLFILEAMKMENEIVAPKDGTIDSILVSKGNAVDTGAILCTIV